MTDRPEGQPAVVEWGHGRPGHAAWPYRLAVLRDPRVVLVLSALGALALFGSLASEWLATTYIVDGEPIEQQVAGVGQTGAWGSGWVVGVLALSVAAGLSLFGPEHLRVATRATGIAVAGALLGVLVAASVSFSRGYNALVLPVEIESEGSLQRGVYLGYLGLALVGAALWLARPAMAGPAVAGPAVAAGGTEPAAPVGWRGFPAPRRPEPVEPGPDGAAPAPGDLTVGPAEPFVHPTDDHEWR